MHKKGVGPPLIFFIHFFFSSGKNCEYDIEECAVSPCQNGAACLERSNLTLYEPEFGYFDNFTYETAGGFICECVPGFTGNFMHN